MCSADFQSYLVLLPNKFLIQSFPVASLCLGSISPWMKTALSQIITLSLSLCLSRKNLMHYERIVEIGGNHVNSNEKGLFHERQSVHVNLIRASITSPAGLGWELPWSLTSSTCWSPYQGIIARPIVQDTKMQPRQKRLMPIQDDQAWSRSKHW